MPASCVAMTCTLTMDQARGVTANFTTDLAPPIDTTYGTAGVGTITAGPSRFGALNDTWDLPDGSFYGRSGNVYHFDANGVADMTFGQDGHLFPANFSPISLAVAPDGGLIGVDRSWNGVRYRPDGTVDSTFSFARPSALRRERRRRPRAPS